MDKLPLAQFTYNTAWHLCVCVCVCVLALVSGDLGDHKEKREGRGEMEKAKGTMGGDEYLYVSELMP